MWQGLSRGQVQSMRQRHNRQLTGDPSEYRRHRPEATLLYQVIEEYWYELQVQLAGSTNA
jgi:hypothetical protein